MCEQVVEYGKDGYSRAEIAAGLEITRDTLYRWQHEHPEFSDAISRASDLSLAWWERNGRTNLTNKDFNHGLYRQCMSGRFPAEPYRERVEHTGKDGGPIETKGEATVKTILDVSNLSDEQLGVIASIRVVPHAD